VREKKKKKPAEKSENFKLSFFPYNPPLREAVQLTSPGHPHLLAHKKMAMASSDAPFATSAVDSALPRVVITGVAGFIGSNLAAHLVARGCNVLGIDNLVCGYEENLTRARTAAAASSAGSFSFLRASCGDTEAAAALQARDVVIHLGANSALSSNQEAPGPAYANNVASTAGLLEACRLSGVAQVIFVSTGAAHYENTTELPQSVFAANFINSLGKKHCEELVLSYYEDFGLPFTSLRFCYVFGPEQDAACTPHPALIPYLIDCFRRGDAPLLHANAEQPRDYVYIGDLLKVFDLLLARKEGALNTEINVCSGRAVSVREIVACVQRVMGVEIEPVYRDPQLLCDKTPRLWEGACPFPRERMREEVEKYMLGDGANTAELLGWRPETGLEDGVRTIVTSGVLGER
jgi:nucleoside-diphosphate-sugar epimerase